MTRVTVLIFHRDAPEGESHLVRLLSRVRGELAASHAQLFRDAGAAEVRVEREWHEGGSFGAVLASLAPAGGGLVVLSGGAVPLLTRRDAARLVETAAASSDVALTNNRYSSDVCAVAGAAVLRRLPPLPTDNALPRWLEEHAGYAVAELPGRERLGLDLDTPSDVALAALSRSAPRWLRATAGESRIAIPRLDELRAIAGDPFAELLVFGRSSARTLRWLERNVRCRVRFLAEERGMRASSGLAINAPKSGSPAARVGLDEPRPRATLGFLLDERGPEALSDVAELLAHGAIVDSRVLMAHRWGVDESTWPTPADRFASDLHRWEEVTDPWLRALTKSAAESRLPVLLGGHSLVGPGIPLLLG